MFSAYGGASVASVFARLVHLVSSTIATNHGLEKLNWQ